MDNSTSSMFVKFFAGVGIGSIVIWAYKKYAVQDKAEPKCMVLNPIKTTVPQE